jgi:hypothetical protein
MPRKSTEKAPTTAPSTLGSPKATKKSGSSKGKHHPTYDKMVSRALLALNDRSGSSVAAISKYLKEHYKFAQSGAIDDSKLRKQVFKVVKALVEAGRATQINQSFRLTPKGRKAVKKPTRGRSKKRVFFFSLSLFCIALLSSGV